MPFRDGKVDITSETHKTWRLQKPLVYEGKTQTLTVPAGFVTDFASVPQFMFWLIPSYGIWTLAAILHDFLCVCLAQDYNARQFASKMQKSGKYSGTDILNMHNSKKAPVSSRDTDGLFRRVMRESGVPFVRRWVMWAGVRWGAVFNPARRKDVHKDLPLVLLWSILVLPVILPATLFIWLGLAIDYIVNLCLRWVT